MKRSLTVVALAIVAALANAGKTHLRAQDTPVDMMVARNKNIAKAAAHTLGANAMKFTSTLSTIGKVCVDTEKSTVSFFSEIIC